MSQFRVVITEKQNGISVKREPWVFTDSERVAGFVKYRLNNGADRIEIEARDI